VALRSTAALVAGNQAQALADARGNSVTALPLLPDAKQFSYLDPRQLTLAQARYGRAPDARLPNQGQGATA
jgi:hypothetical protein